MNRLWNARVTSHIPRAKAASALTIDGIDRGVTLLGGSPFPICTTAHGTAYGIAGQGVANLGAPRAALLLALEMAQRDAR